MFLILVILLFSILFYFLSIIFSSKFEDSMFFNNPFECGFETEKSSRLPYSMKFFLISILFLIFDVEIVLFFLSIFSFNSVSYFKILFFIYLMILYLGFLIEWGFNSISWKL